MNEQKSQKRKVFGHWDTLPDGRRRYWREVSGHSGWKARYVKDVDQEKKTIRFFQEIYDDLGRLFEIHEKYPADKGHKRIKEGGDGS